MRKRSPPRPCAKLTHAVQLEKVIVADNENNFDDDHDIPKIAVPTNRERVTLVKVVNLWRLTPGKMMTKARNKVTNTM